MGEALKPVMQFPLVMNRERGTQLNAVCMGADFGHAIVLSGVTCFTCVTAFAVHNAPGLKAQTMDKHLRRIPMWLTMDLTIIAVSAILIAVGVWIGFEGPSLP